MLMQLLNFHILHIWWESAFDLKTSKLSKDVNASFISRNKRLEWQGKYDSFTIDRTGNYEAETNKTTCMMKRDVLGRKCHDIRL